jgi:hypothetical protein
MSSLSKVAVQCKVSPSSPKYVLRKVDDLADGVCAPEPRGNNKRNDTSIKGCPIAY